MKESATISKRVPTYNPFSGPVVERVVYITQPQAEIWVACQLGDSDANRAYNESVTLTLNGNLNAIALLNALQSLVSRHEALRSTFSTDGRFMTIFKNLKITTDYNDLSDLDTTEKDEAIKTYLTEQVNFIFDLVKGPLFRVGLLKLSETEHQLILTAHHIICDGWSIGIMLEELGSLYSANILNTNHNLPNPESFCTYADEQQVYLESSEHKSNENFWLNEFKDSVPQLTLSTDFPRPNLRTFKSERLDFSVDTTLVKALKKTGVKAGCSLVNTLLSAFEIFLCSQTGQTDIVLGLPAAGQAVTGRTQLIGHCVNLLPLRSRISLSDSFNTYLKNRKSSLFDAYDHQQLSFGQLLQKLAIARDPSRVPLVPVVFNIDMGMTSQVSFKDLSFQLHSNPRTFETFEIFLNASGSEDAFILEWQYNSSLFTSSTIEKMMHSLEDIFKKIVANPESSIADIVKVDDAAYRVLNETAVSYPNSPLHELLRGKAQEFSNKQAIKFINSEVSYQDFNNQVNQLANQLSAIGVRSGDVVGVALPRSIELVISLVAIMQCGAAYLPLDPKYPQKRLEYMLEDSMAGFLISSETNALQLETNAESLLIENLISNLPQYPVTPVSLKVENDANAYLLYTSGSTGKPKGVAITHKNLVNFLYSMLDQPGINENDKLLSVTTISFDIAGLELYIPLLTGATLVLAKDETAKDGRIIMDVVKKEGITMLQATPTTWQMMLDLGWDTPLPIKALCGGEALPLNLAKKLIPKVNELWNMYGPTETTIWSSVKQIRSEDNIITIGKPIANTQFYILNDQQQLMEPGKTGEIIIGGDGVAKGYWNRPDLTEEKFINNPFDQNSKTKLYRTGDLGQLLPTGELLCMGRIDQQVKIRGHRIELEEIEQALESLDGIQNALVIVKDDNIISFLISNVIDEIGKSDIDSWKQLLTKYLPAHMIPQEFDLIDDFPKTLNGKIDRNALLKQTTSQSKTAEYTAPRSNTEIIVSEIWCKNLKKEKIDIYSDFFELGGHSIIGIKVIASIEEKIGTKLPLSILMVYPTIEKLATFIDKDIEKVTWSSLVPIRTEGTKTPLYMVHGAGHNILFFNSTAKHLDENQPVYGLQSKGLNGTDIPLDKVEDMAAHYISEIQATNPSGPYALGGYSFGGVVAYEMARQLVAQGKTVETVALIDTYVFPMYYFKDSFRKKLASVYYVLGKVYFALTNMFSSVEKFKERIDIFKTLGRNFYLKFTNRVDEIEATEEELLNLEELERAQDFALDRYTITPDHFKVDLLVADDNVFFKHDKKNYGWKNVALNGVVRHRIPGNHARMFTPPNDKKLASIMQNILDSN